MRRKYMADKGCTGKGLGTVGRARVRLSLINDAGRVDWGRADDVFWDEAMLDEFEVGGALLTAPNQIVSDD